MTEPITMKEYIRYKDLQKRLIEKVMNNTATDDEVKQIYDLSKQLLNYEETKYHQRNRLIDISKYTGTEQIAKTNNNII